MSVWSTLKPNLGLLGVLLVFAGLATWHSIVVPLTQGEDELAHYRYISFIAETGRLPINPAERQAAWYRSDWPPLYHLLVGWLLSPFDTTTPPLKDVGESPHRRLVGEIFYPRLLIYTEDMTQPWQDGILAWQVGRFLSVLLATVAVGVTYATAHEWASTFPQRLSPDMFATLVTAVLAFTPRFGFTSAMLSDDSLLILLCSVFIWLLWRLLHGADRWWVYALAGVVLGLSIVIKYSTGLLPLVLLLVVWWRVKQAGYSWRWAVNRIAVAWGCMLLATSWWFGWLGYYFNSIEEDGLFVGLLRPVLAAGPDVSMRRVFAVFGGESFTGAQRPAAVAEGSLWDWLVYLFQTFWGVPVLEYDPLFPAAYLVMAVLCGASLAGLWRVWRTAEPSMRVSLALLALVVALLVPFPLLRFFLTYNVLETGQGRHLLYPAAQSIPLLLVLGWLHWTRRAWVVAVVPLLLLGWTVYQVRYMTSTYPDPLPVRTTTFNPATIPQPLRYDFGDDIRLLGYDFQPDEALAIINLTLFWEARQSMNENYRVRVQLVDETGASAFTWLSHPVNGLYPTGAWDAGDVIRDELPLPLANVPAGWYDLHLDWLAADDTPLVAEPLSFIRIPLQTRPPIADAATLGGGVRYRLWGVDAPLRARQTVALSWDVSNDSVAPTLALIGPDDRRHPPDAVSTTTAMFIIQPGWTSGPYRLDINGATSRPVLAVANQARQFELPAALTDHSGWTQTEATFATPNAISQTQLVGYILPETRFQPGDSIPLTLVWRGMAPALSDYVTFAVLLDANQQPHGSVDRYPAGFYSPMLWANGEIVVDEFSVPLAGSVPDGVYFLHVGQYQQHNGEPESLPLLIDGKLSETTAVHIGPVKIGGPPPGVTLAAPEFEHRINQALGGQIRLLGYDFDTSRETLQLTLYWQADTTPSADYTTFVHLRAGDDTTVAQQDNPPAKGQYPTRLWAEGDIIADNITLSLTDLPAGEYVPVVGLYDFHTGQRLPKEGNSATEIRLAPIRVP